MGLFSRMISKNKIEENLPKNTKPNAFDKLFSRGEGSKNNCYQLKIVNSLINEKINIEMMPSNIDYVRCFYMDGVNEIDLNLEMSFNSYHNRNYLFIDNNLHKNLIISYPKYIKDFVMEGLIDVYFLKRPLLKKIELMNNINCVFNECLYQNLEVILKNNTLLKIERMYKENKDFISSFDIKTRNNSELKIGERIYQDENDYLLDIENINIDSLNNSKINIYDLLKTRNINLELRNNVKIKLFEIKSDNIKIEASNNARIDIEKKSETKNLILDTRNSPIINLNLLKVLKNNEK